MKTFSPILNALFVSAIAFFAIAAFLMFLTQCVALITLNGPLSIAVSSYTVKIAGPISAIPAIAAVILGYTKKEAGKD